MATSRSVVVMLCVVGGTGMSACALEEPELGRGWEASVVENGENLNGENLNGENLNGENLNGSTLGTMVAWVALDGARQGNALFDHVELAGSELRGSIGAAHRQGDDFVGVTLVGESDTGAALTLRIAAVTPPPAGSDVWRYRVDYREINGSWQPICLDPDTGAARSAVALAGIWDRRAGVSGGGDKIDDPGLVTFACPAIDMGYRPWATVGGVSLDRHHQACVRLMRNDYCGDGTSHTVDGTQINVYDGLAIQQDTRSWLAEAEWGADGASCLTVNNRAPLALFCRTRLMLLPQLLTCGAKSHFASGTTTQITERPLLGLNLGL
jgi:hypothetical protein